MSPNAAKEQPTSKKRLFLEKLSRDDSKKSETGSPKGLPVNCFCAIMIIVENGDPVIVWKIPKH